MILSEQAKEARRKYKREWARKNPDKVRAATARHWEKVAAREAAQQAADKEQAAREATE